MYEERYFKHVHEKTMGHIFDAGRRLNAESVLGK